MKAKLIRILSVCMTIIMLLTVIPLGTITASAANLTMADLKQRYPEGSTWKTTYDGASQCHGWALMVADLVYGYTASSSNRCRNRTRLYTSNDIKAGDVIRVYRSSALSDSKAHTIFVTGVSGNTITYADCNWDWNCGIRWDETTSKASLTDKSFGYGIQYVLSAPYEWDGGPVVCNCSTSYAGNYTCTTSTISLTIRSGHGTSYSAIGSIPSGETVYVSKADGTWAHVTYNGISGYASMEYLKIPHTHSYQSHYEAAHPHRVYKKCSCGDWDYTGATKVLSTCSSCWAAASVSFNKSSVSLVIPTAQTTTLNIQLSAAETWPSGAGYAFDYDSNIISMSQNGTVVTLTAKNTGSTNFTMKIVDKNNNNALIKTAVCPITVTNATYTISYNANGGTGAPSSQVKTYDVPLTLSKTIPKRTGYTFMGWSTNSGATTASYMPGDRFIKNSNTTLYAVWKSANQLSFNGSFSAPIHFGNQEYYFKYTPSKSGKYVIYSEASKNTKVYLYNSNGTLLTSNDDGGEGSNFRLAYNLTAGSTYYYGIKFYSSSQTGSISFKFGEVGTIKYDANSGTGAPSEQEVDYGKRVTLSTVKPTRKGYTFLGWSLRNNATEPNYKGGENVQTTSNITLYAVWEAGCATNNHDYGYWKYSDSSYHIRSCKNCNSTQKSSHTWGEPQYIESLKQYKYFCSGCASEKYMLITESIEVATLPSKTIYEVGDVFDKTGLKVRAKFASGGSSIVSGYSLSGFDSSTLGTQAITIKYDGKTTTFNIIVKCKHKYTNSCDTNCNVCGATRIVGAHKYSSNCDTTCNYCGAKRTIKHTYKLTTTKKATLTENGKSQYKCDVCGWITENNAKTINKVTSFKLSTTTYTYDGKVKEPVVTVKDSAGKVLKKGTDYTVSYPSGRKAVGTYKVTIKMKGNYSGTKTLTFKITPANISTTKISLSSTSYTYNGAVRKPAVTVKTPGGTKLTEGTHYTVTYASGRKTPGTYKVTIKGKGNYTGTKTLTFKINPINVSKCNISLSSTSYTYNGSVKTPTVTVKNANGTKLTAGTHYTVTYASGRKNVGSYTVKVTMKGNYTGTKTLSFKIVPKAASINTLTAKTKAISVKLNRSLQQSTGYQIQYSTSKSFTNPSWKTISNYNTSTTTLTSLKAKTTYYVRVRTYKTVGSTKYYSAWSSYKTVKTK